MVGFLTLPTSRILIVAQRPDSEPAFFASLTNSSDATTYFRLGIGNGQGATTPADRYLLDLVLNSNYLVVTRFSHPTA